MKKKLFGTDGIRGKANIYPMTGEMAFKLGRAVTHFFQHLSPKKEGRPKIIVGKDTRLSCYMLEQAFSSGICSQGGHVILTGPIPTPGVAFLIESMRATAGVMISASHNPYYDNGIKIFDHNGLKLSDSVELILEEYLEGTRNIPDKTEDQLGRAKRLEEIEGRYIVYAKSHFKAPYSLEGLSLVLDCAHGAAYKVAPKIFEELGATVIPLGVSPNGININDNCGALHPVLGIKTVLERKADLGILLDGDADRVLFVSSKGTVVAGDQILGLLSYYLLETKEIELGEEIVGTVMTNYSLEKLLYKKGLKFFRTAVGDRYILERLKLKKGTLGGETSGHLIIGKEAKTGDGPVAALKVLEAMKYYNCSLEELIAPFQLAPQILKNIPVSHRPPLEELTEFQKFLKQTELQLEGRGRILVRYSGTENLARIMIEGDYSSDELETMAHSLSLSLTQSINQITQQA